MRGDDPQDSVSFFGFLASSLTEEWERPDNPDGARGGGKIGKDQRKKSARIKNLRLLTNNDRILYNEGYKTICFEYDNRAEMRME
jgi:hypothetical protein